MTLKERIENNLTLYTLSMLLAGFLGGLATYKFMADVVGTKNLSSAECTADQWKPAARKAQWIPDAECPAYALDVKVTSPGNGSVVSIRSSFADWFQTPVIVSSTRPLTAQSSIGVVLKPSDSPNYFVVFPEFSRAGSDNIFRTEEIGRLPFTLKPDMKIELRALVIDSKDRIGAQFSSVEQIRSADTSVFLSEPIQVQLR